MKNRSFAILFIIVAFVSVNLVFIYVFDFKFNLDVLLAYIFFFVIGGALSFFSKKRNLNKLKEIPESQEDLLNYRNKLKEEYEFYTAKFSEGEITESELEKSLKPLNDEISEVNSKLNKKVSESKKD